MNVPTDASPGPAPAAGRETRILHGSCHCGAVKWQFEGMPESATICNCTICRRYGVLWSYGFEDRNVTVTGPTTYYIRGDSIEFHFCPQCGCVGYYRSLRLDVEGRRRIAVNLRLTEPEPVAQLPVRRFEGLDSFKALPRDGRCVADYWF